MEYTDIDYRAERGAAFITINRPEKMNAFRARTCEELIHALDRASWDKAIGVVVLGGAGERAFCTGGDQSSHEPGRGYGGRGIIGLPVEALHSAIRDCPKPVIARVQGFAIGGGNVIAVLCDLTIAAETAVFGQVGPRMGSVDPGFGTAYLARVVGEKKAREMWFLCKRYSAREAEAMGLVNIVVAPDQLDTTVRQWCDELLLRSPTALALAKRSMNADTEQLRGLSLLSMTAVAMYYATDESAEGGNAQREKRPPDFSPWRIGSAPSEP